MSDFKNLAMIAAFFKIFGFDTSTGFILGGVGVLLFIVIGYLDLKHGIWKVEAEFATKEVNPYFQRLEESMGRQESKNQANPMSAPAPPNQQ